MPVVKGEISAMRRDRKGIQVDDEWYSSFQPIPQGIERGVVVEFDFQKKGQWNNIKGQINIVEGNSPEPGPITVNTQPQADLPPHYQITKGYASLMKEFPVPFDHPDRAIIRQNSLTNAIKAAELMGGYDAKKGPEDFVNAVLTLAAEFEAYSTGDNEREAAEAESGE